ncbi:hypothetical protein BV22DRAFT_1042346 [Leucogyrophana mollusca]|uniref:Uncharacterized protein n=1 Tax=Leucogyrophana mollusca TaxID=85980 RepID=A0ACB8AVC6_9AGAM|nr:hypothetical protein BV22DRAFT_1042346 [Leucogyrophana mollusca]
MERELSSISLSALSLLCWDLCLTLDDEVRFIWSKTWRVPVKWLYLTARYVGIASFMCVQTRTFFISLMFRLRMASVLMISYSVNRSIGGGGNPLALSCKASLALQSGMTQVLVTVVELILMLRVHALYNRDRRVSVFLLFLAIGGTAVGIAGLCVTVPNAQFNSVCGVTDIGTSMTPFSFAFVVIDVTLLLLTILKCLHTFRITGRDAPVVVLMLRDGTAAFLATVSLLIATSVSLVVDRGKFLSVVTPWFKAVLSCAGCRLIINMQRLSLDSRILEHDAHGLPTITSRIVIEAPTTDSSTVIY